MTANQLFAVALRLTAIWFVSWGIITLLSMITGPFATLIFGVGLLFYASKWRPIEGYPS